MIAIEVNGLKKNFADIQALDDVSLRFDPGLMHGLIGPDGAGKTTLLRHLIGLLQATKGHISYLSDQREVSFETIRPFIAYMPQQQSLYPDLSIHEHLEFFKALYGLNDKEYMQKREGLLEMTRLSSFIHRPAGQLSGGMYKKLGLMCALLSDPKVLLLDEPTNGVDPISRREFWELLYSLSEKRILIIVATAYMDEAERCAKAHLLSDGHVIAAGEPRELLHQARVRSFDEFFLQYEEKIHG